jgi:hypothetical protein
VTEVNQPELDQAITEADRAAARLKEQLERARRVVAEARLKLASAAEPRSFKPAGRPGGGSSTD